MKQQSNQMPRKGMNRDTYPSELKEQEYSMALNANVMSEDNGSMITIQNESSNSLCSRFKIGFTVVGAKYDRLRNRSYFFLFNQETGCSEIGYIDVDNSVDPEVVTEKNCGCSPIAVFDDGLEHLNNISPHCEYHTILSDYCEKEGACSGCLNFNPNFPIKDVVVRHSVLGDELYFTDDYNPPRYVRLDYIEDYFKKYDKCNDTYEDTCLQCDKLRIFSLYEKPCIQPKVIQNGGSLKAGVYEMFFFLADNEGEITSNLIGSTNPISIFDHNNKIIDQTHLDYQTNLGFTVELSFLDEKYDRYKAIMVYTSGNDPTPIYYDYDSWNIENNVLFVSNIPSTVNKYNEQTLLQLRPYYERSKGIVEANGYLLQHGLTAREVINLQPVVNLMGSFANWMSYQAKEDLFKDGISTAKYKGRFRDEVYAEGIQFHLKGGGVTSLFPLISRPATNYDLDEFVDETGHVIVDNDNVDSISLGSSDCADSERRFRWQFENTATKDVNGIYCGNGNEVIIEPYEDIIECETAPLIIKYGIIPFDIDTNIIKWINDNRISILNGGIQGVDDIKVALEGGFEEPCTVDFPDECGNPIPQPSYVKAVDVKISYTKTGNINIDSITHTDSPVTCNIFPQNCDNNGCDDILVNFTEIEEAYGIDSDPLNNVYVRKPITNINCQTATTITEESPSNFYLVDKIGDTLNDLLTSIPSSLSTPQFSSFIHNNASWIKVNFNGKDRVVFELTELNCMNSNVNSSSTVRISFFSNCPASNEVTSLSKIVSLNNMSSNSDRFYELDVNYFPLGIAYIAIDSPYKEVGGKYVLTPPCGCFSALTRIFTSDTYTAYEGLEFVEVFEYVVECTREVPKVYGDCDPIPYDKGKFAYVESTFKYPCNSELYDSSKLKLTKYNVPSEIISDLENWYVDLPNSTSLEYVLTSDANFMDKPIRHFKYPSNDISPFMSNAENESGKDLQAKSLIYPLGFHLSNEVINYFLDVAVYNGLITQDIRNQIIGYEIFRGDRRINRSVIARGIASNMRKYKDTNNDTIFYPNFPFNTVGKDIINNQNDKSDDMFTFLSPETLFEKPTLPSEVTIDGFLTGGVLTTFAPMDRHPDMVVLGKKARDTATGLAISEVTLEVLLKSMQFTIDAIKDNPFVSIPAGIAAGVAIASMAVDAVVSTGKKRMQWLNIFYDMGQGYNLAYIALGRANYNLINKPAINSRLRAINLVTYVNPDDLEVRDERLLYNYKVNNFNRENSVLFKLEGGVDYPTVLNAFDNSVAQIKYDKTGTFTVSRYNGNKMKSVIPFMTLKQYLPGQWGTINSISWLPTNYCGRLDSDNSCEAVFGGDAFISRLEVKKKLPIFRKNAFSLPPDIPYKYSRYLNVASVDFENTFDDNIGFIDYKTAQAPNAVSGLFFPEARSAYTLFNSSGKTSTVGSGLTNGNQINEFYVTDKYKFLINYFGIPSFLVESEINCNYRYARVGTESRYSDDFSPNVGNLIDWVQEENVPMSVWEKFFYNKIYSKVPHKKAYEVLPSNYNKEEYDKKEDGTNMVIFSQRDDKTNSLRSPWLNYKPLDFYRFSNNNGVLIDIATLESEQMMFRFTDGYSILGAIDPIRDRVDPTSLSLGMGHIFNDKAINFNKTDLGYNGTQHKQILSTPFGHYTVDAKRGKVFEIAPGAKGINEITTGLNRWFKEQLPFKILKQFPNLDIDNNYNGVGIAMGWDEYNMRFLLTKKDYIINDTTDIYFEDGKLYDESEESINAIINREEGKGWTFSNRKGNKLVFTKEEEIDIEDCIDGLTFVGMYFATKPDDVEGADSYWTGGHTCNRAFFRIQIDDGVTFYTFNGANQYINLNNIGGNTDENNNIFPFPYSNVSLQRDRYSEFSISYQDFLNSGVSGTNWNISIVCDCQEGINCSGTTNNQCHNDALWYRILDPDGNILAEGSGIGQILTDFNPCDNQSFSKTTTKEVLLESYDYNKFEDVSWTVGYSPILKNWISYYSYKPNYYLSYNDYFQSGVNNVGSKEHGLWSHLPFISSYQVFYGKLYPFMIEYPLSGKFNKSTLQSVNYWLDVRKYSNRYNFANVFGIGFNKAYIYNDFQNTGLLELDFQKTNDRSQLFNYPKYNGNSLGILQSEIQGLWSFNYIYNAIRNEKSGLPSWLNDKVNIGKEINHSIMNYGLSRRDRMVGDYFLVRLINDYESRFKFIFKTASDERNYYK